MNNLLRWFIIKRDKSKGMEHELMCFKSLYGKFQVRYSDGKISTKMDYYCARDYASMFEGTVYHVKYGEVK